MGWNMSVIMPIIGGISTLVIIVALIYAFVALRMVRMKTDDQRAFIDSLEALRREHDEMKATLDVVAAKVTFIEKMIKDVE